jgi:pyruvate/oxaloacetate carboxyltransferase
MLHCIGPADSRDDSRTYMQLFTAGIDVVHVTAVPSSGAVGHPQTDSAMLLVRA